MASEFELELLPELEAESEFGEFGELGQAGEYEFGELNEAGGFGEQDGEFEFALQGELNPIRRIYPDAMMEHLAHEAVQAETEQEAAEQFLPLIPLAAAQLLPLAARLAPNALRALPRIASTLNRVAPGLTGRVSQIARRLYRNPRTRPLLRTLPTVVNRSISNIARQAASGQSVTPQAAMRALQQQASQMLRDRPQCVNAIRQSRAMDRQLHRTVPGITPAGNGCSRCGG